MSDLKDLDALYELGQLYREKGDYLTAIEKLELASKGYFKKKSFEKYLDCLNYLLRMYAERGEDNQITKAKEQLQDLVIKEGIDLSTKTYYILGVCACYKQQYDIALDYFQKSLTIALSEDNKEDVCHAINGIAATYYYLDRLSDALKEIYNLQVFFQVLELPDVKLSTMFLNAHILRKMKKYDQALEIFWQCYDVLKEIKNMPTFVGLLNSMGKTYLDIGDKDLARTYLGLAKKSVDSKNMVMLAKDIDESLEKLGESEETNFDLVFDSSTKSVFERKLGKINFKNQFILLDLLRLFVQHPGEVYSKEDLVKEVWRQSYDPSVHDNKIYVTIKRLRKLIEPNYDKPKYIFRAKNGYYMNKGVRILMEQ